MRAAAMLMLSIVASGSGAIGQGASGAGQSAANAPQTQTSDEVIVRGRRLTDLRVEVEQAQERAYTIFNEINSDDDFDVYCREERRYHSRATTRICRPQFENRISGKLGSESISGAHGKLGSESISGAQKVDSDPNLKARAPLVPLRGFFL